jgi:iron complex transport system ATP-binding protein
MSMRQTLLETQGLVAGYRSRRAKPVTIAGPLSVTIRAGQLICLLGPNGSGKSTLLRTLSGLQPSLGGTIHIMGDPGPAQRSPAALARKISLVLTDPVRYSNLTAYSLVALGRYPYSGWLGTLKEEDRRIIAWAMEVTGIASYAERKIGKLSDGESQKVMLARALAQDTPLMMLDEPTAHLDLPSRIQIMQLLHKMARQTQKGILLSTHELDLALQVADELWLLQSGGQLDRGVPEDLVLNGTFESVFDKEGILFDKRTGSFNIHSGHLKKIGLAGNGVAAFWTKRALQREGFEVTAPGQAETDIVVVEGATPTWVLAASSGRQTFDSLSGLLDALRNQSV